MALLGCAHVERKKGGRTVDRLTIRNSDGSISQPTNTRWADVFVKLAGYEDQEEAGLLWYFPVKPGDTVMAYLEPKAAVLDECRITRIEISTDYREPLFTAVCYEKAEYGTFWLSDFGKEIFTLDQYWKMPEGATQKKAKTKRKE